ncbi:Zinc finger C2HC domain-containing protein 1A [Oopsacas minuta]|uniref:Zinc finger C2HC domain-containing protein 1A n=1 Tax=Oopsacas minuta TaxID=111878 RepID=A0AAV7KCP2_9METZ|nr:Zinc finger C2HC domain-containing protein 1A [Oopsacas minuta]
MSETPVPLSSCPCCGRNFHPDVIDRHVGICQKNKQNSMKRRTFDSSKMRARDTEIEKLNEERKFLPSHMREKPKLPAKKSNWKAKHDEFIRTIRGARGGDGSDYASQRDAPKFENPDYVQCEICSRRFNEAAAERHIPFCKEQQNRLKQKGCNQASAADRVTKRTQYKAPVPKSSQKRALIPTPKQTRTRPLHEDTDTDHISTQQYDRRIARGERSRGETHQDLSSTRDINRDKRHPYTKNNERTNDHETMIDRKSSHNSGYDMTSGTSMSNTESSQSVQHVRGYPSQLPTLRNKSHSASSVGSNGSNGSSNRIIPLNEYGTPMSKFCYECGGSYPVPQAKFCCECGTRRI